MSIPVDIPFPEHWQTFEELCFELWKRIWKDPDTQKNGRSGQTQEGVDIFGRPNCIPDYAGVQCKLKSHTKRNALTQNEVKKEVNNAKSFKPALKELIIATTALRDVDLQQLVREITQEHSKQSLFPVRIFSWEDIKELLEKEENIDIFRKFYPAFFDFTVKLFVQKLEGSRRGSLTTDINIENLTLLLLEPEEEPTHIAPIQSLKLEILDIAQKNEESSTTNNQDEIGNKEKELDFIRELINCYKLTEARKQLDQISPSLENETTADTRFRIQYYYAEIFFKLNKQEESAKYYLAAYEENPKHKKANAIKALGHLIQGEKALAKKYAKLSIKLHPEEMASYQILYEADTTIRVEKIIKMVPVRYREDSGIAFSLGEISRRQGNLAESIKWLRLSKKNDKEDSLNIKACLAEVLLEIAFNDPAALYFEDGTAHESIKLMQEAVQLLIEAWNKLQDEEVKKARIYWQINLANAYRFLKQFRDAEVTLERILKLEPENADAIKIFALVTNDQKQYPETVRLLKKIENNPKLPETKLMLAETLMHLNRVDESIDILEKFLETQNDAEYIGIKLKDDASRILIQCYLKQERISDAERIANLQLQEDEKSIRYLVDKAETKHKAGNTDEAIKILHKAKKQLTSLAKYRDKLDVANGYYDIEAYAQAAEIYATIADTAIDNALTRRLLFSFYYAGLDNAALKIAQEIREKATPLLYTLEVESLIYEDMGDLENAIKACNSYLALSPEHLSTLLRLTFLYLRSDNLEEVDNFLNKSFNIQAMSLTLGLQLTYLYKYRDRYQEAIEIAYELRKKHFSELESHLKYFGLFLEVEKHNNDLFETTIIAPGTAICLTSEQTHDKQWFIIEDSINPDLSQNEINLSNPITQKLLGKSVGDKIILGENRPQSTITQVLSKYVRAFHQSVEIHQRFFPEDKSIEVVEFPSQDNDSILDSLHPILDKMGRRNDFQRQIEDHYKDGRLTIGSIAAFIHKNPITIWGGLIYNPRIKLRFAYEADIQKASKTLAHKKRLVIDIFALLTIHELGIADIIITTFGKLGIAQSTIDLLYERLNDLKGTSFNGYLTLVEVEGQIYKEEVTKEDIEKELKFLQELKCWLRSNCIVFPVKNALDAPRNERYKFYHTFERSCYDTVLLAQEEGRALYSDDERLRAFAETTSPMDTTWTQALVHFQLENSIISPKTYANAVLKLIMLNYEYISINAVTLIEAFRRENWKTEGIFSKTCEILFDQKTTLETAIPVFADFLYLAWGEAPTNSREELLKYILTNLTQDKEMPSTFNALARYTNIRFQNEEFLRIQILTLFKEWHENDYQNKKSP